MRQQVLEILKFPTSVVSIKSLFPFFLDEKRNKKIKTDARFTRKTYAQKAEIPKLLPSVVKQWVFLRFFLLFFGSPSKVSRLRVLE